MSTVQPCPTLSPAASDVPRHPDLAALAAALQEIARALPACAAANAPEPPNATAAESTGAPEAAKAAALRPAALERGGETRAFYFSPAALHMERELLRKYRAQDFQGLLEEAHALLVGLVSLMRSVPKEVRVRGHVISSLGAQLDHACALLLRMRHVYEKVMPVRH